MTDTPGRRRSKKLDTAAFIKAIADRMFLPEDTVLAIWETSADVLLEALLREERIIIKKFGVFRVSKMGFIRFKAASIMKQAIKEIRMEKYGVEMDNEAVLMARVTGECPTCKRALTSKDPPSCPNCGTAPFEQRSISRQSIVVENFGKTYEKPNEEK